MLSLTGTLANKRKAEEAALEWYKLANLTTPEAVGVILISSDIWENGENLNFHQRVRPKSFIQETYSGNIIIISYSKD